MSLRILFLGTPDFAVPALQHLNKAFNLTGVVTQPDRPGGRGRKLIPPPVKDQALQLGLEVYQTNNINSRESLKALQTWKPDLICVVAFGQILNPEILALPSAGCLNLHASLLPRWRGAAPINAAILAGDEYSGVTVMKMGPGLDDGPLLSQKRVAISPQDTAGSLSDSLSNLGAELLVETIPPYLKGEISPRPQDSRQATYARSLKKQDGELDFTEEAQFLTRQIRAYSPWPGTFTHWQGSRLLVHAGTAANVTSPGPGVFTTYEGKPAIGTGKGLLVLDELQLAGRSRLSGRVFLNGIPSWDAGTPNLKPEN